MFAAGRAVNAVGDVAAPVAAGAADAAGAAGTAAQEAVESGARRLGEAVFDIGRGDESWLCKAVE